MEGEGAYISDLKTIEENADYGYFIVMNSIELRKSIEENTSFTFSRSGGNGGQNVNKLNTKAHGKIHISGIKGLDERELSQVLKKLSGKINSENFLCIDVDDERYQDANRRIALDRLESWIKSAAYIKPRRKKTKPTAASREKRLAGKKIRSMIKKNRASNRSIDF